MNNSKSKKGTKVNNFNELVDQILSIDGVVVNDEITWIILYSVFDNNKLCHKFLNILK